MAFSITAFIHRLRTAPRRERELWLAGFAVGFGLLVLPFLVYVAGNETLGVYEHGGLGSYLGDFFRGLFRPHLAYWLIVFGPYLMIMLARGLWLIRKQLHVYLAQRRAPPVPPAPSGRSR